MEEIEPPLFRDEELEERVWALLQVHDAAHDIWHLRRVWGYVRAIARTEPEADVRVLQIAAFFHDVMPKQPGGGHADVTVPMLASWLSPLQAPHDVLTRAVEAINAHSFSRGLPPPSLEAAILQDADRLDAIGAVGIARCFTVGGMLGRPIYAPDTSEHSVQHMYDKLLHLRDGMHTSEGRRLAQGRHAFMEAFLARLMAEWEEACGRQRLP